MRLSRRSIPALACFALVGCTAPIDSSSSFSSSAPEDDSPVAASIPAHAYAHALTRSGGAELNSSVMLLGDWDWRYDGGTSRCERMVERAAALGNKTVSFVVTHYFRATPVRDANGNPAYDEYGTARWQAYDYCFMKGDSDCRPFAKSASAPWGEQWRIKDDWKGCVKKALYLGMNIAVVPHLDDGARAGAWRNNTILDPVPELSDPHFAGASFKSVLLDPMTEAINQAISETKSAACRCASRYKARWARPCSRIRRRSPSPPTTSARSWPPSRLSSTRASRSASASTSTASTAACSRSTARRWRACSTTSTSSGCRATGTWTFAAGASDWNRTIDSVVYELSNAGVDLRRRIRDSAMHLHFSEVGLGGGQSGAGASPATSLEEVAWEPYFGVGGTYAPERDPWAQAKLRDYRAQYYARLLDFLARPRRPRRRRTRQLFRRRRVHLEPRLLGFPGNLSQLDVVARQLL